jgi:hypothetical protein
MKYPDDFDKWYLSRFVDEDLDAINEPPEEE